MITAVIAEKPSVAKDIANVLNVRERHDGYLSGNGYLVTWAFGHLVQLAMPEAYGYTGFRRENLPILPQEFKYIPRQIREGKEYKPDPGVLKQLKVIREVFDRSDRIVVATDAGREGEAIHRYIYNYLGCRKPCLRLWISSLTDRAIREGLDNLRPGSDYDNLYRAAEARAIADWEIGLNATQALSIAAGQGIYSLGRVQTPTLMMICSRYLENRDFTPQTYFRLKVTAEKDGTPFAAISELRYETLPAANAALAAVTATGTVQVADVQRREVSQEPPLLYDLTALQKEANGRYGFSADKTLSVAQSLYEKKVLSYPRTGSRYLSDDVFDEIPDRIALLKRYPTQVDRHGQGTDSGTRQDDRTGRLRTRLPISAALYPSVQENHRPYPQRIPVGGTSGVVAACIQSKNSAATRLCSAIFIRNPEISKTGFASDIRTSSYKTSKSDQAA